MDPNNSSEAVPLAVGAVGLSDVAARLHVEDDVAIAKTGLEVGTILALESEPEPGARIRVCQLIPGGHKVALRRIAAGERVHRYGQVIGIASRVILPGEHVHTHNLALQESTRVHGFGVDVQPVAIAPEGERRTFLGYRRADGRVGTRNYVAVISTVNCSAHVTRAIAHAFTPERLAAFPNVDGVIALTHHLGCPTQNVLLQRTLAGMAHHPNTAAFIFVGLGCETNQAADLMESYALRGHGGSALVIQDLGGIRKTVQAGIAAVEELLPVANGVERVPQPLSELRLALQCGGSDSWSGVTANPVVGLVADEVVRQGGTVVLAETPEVHGAEHLLTRRAISRAVGERFVAQVRWWEQYARGMGIQLDDNRSVGNEAGGLTTISEKSLGAVSKAGSTPLTSVHDYAEQVRTPGLAFMNSPGYDPVSVTGQVAGGCNLVLFTTGRGSVFGFKPAPCIKICSNSATYERLIDDMDLNAGRVLAGEAMADVAADLLALVVAVASGQPTKSEGQDVGEAEFSPWNLVGTL